MYSHETITHALTLYNNKKKLNLTIDTICSLIGIVRSTLYEWVDKFSHLMNDKKTHILPKRLSNTVRSSRKVSDNIEAFIIDYVRKNPAFNMKKLSKKLTNMFHITISKSHIYWILHKNNMSHKKVQKNTYPYSKRTFKKALKAHKIAVDKCDNNFTAVDETAVYLGTSSNSGWSEVGKRCKVKSTFNRSNRHSLCMAISDSSVVGYKLIKGSFNTEKFNDFIINDIIPNMPNDTILMDGAIIHKSKFLAEILKENNKEKIINVAYSPQYNPIEFTFNTLKMDVKKSNVTTVNMLNKVLLRFIKKGNNNGFEAYYAHTYNNILEDLKT